MPVSHPLPIRDGDLPPGAAVTDEQAPGIEWRATSIRLDGQVPAADVGREKGGVAMRQRESGALSPVSPSAPSPAATAARLVDVTMARIADHGAQ